MLDCSLGEQKIPPFTDDTSSYSLARNFEKARQKVPHLEGLWIWWWKSAQHTVFLCVCVGGVSQRTSWADWILHTKLPTTDSDLGSIRGVWDWFFFSSLKLTSENVIFMSHCAVTWHAFIKKMSTKKLKKCGRTEDTAGECSLCENDDTWTNEVN